MNVSYSPLDLKYLVVSCPEHLYDAFSKPVPRNLLKQMKLVMMWHWEIFAESLVGVVGLRLVFAFQRGPGERVCHLHYSTMPLSAFFRDFLEIGRRVF